MPNDRTRLPLPEPHGQFLIWDHNAKPNDPVRYRYIFTADQMHAYSDAEIATLTEQVRVLREALESIKHDSEFFSVSHLRSQARIALEKTK